MKDPGIMRSHLSSLRDRRVASIGAIHVLNSERETRNSERALPWELVAPEPGRRWMPSRQKKPYPAKSSLFQVKKLIQVHRPFATLLVGGPARRAGAFATAVPRAARLLLLLKWIMLLLSHLFLRVHPSSNSFRLFRGHSPFHILLSRLGPLASIAVSSGIKRLLAAKKIFFARIPAPKVCPMTLNCWLLSSAIYFPDHVNFEEFKLCTWRPKDY